MSDAARRPLGRTGFQVFPINLGGNVFGWTADREASFEVLDAYREGFLTGKYRKGEKATSRRGGQAPRYLDDPMAVARLERLLAVAKKHGATPAQVALAWQLHKPPVTTPIASATSAAQVKELVGAVRLRLDRDDLGALDA